MWAKIKKTLNSTLGRESFNSLNRIIDVDGYNNFYRGMCLLSFAHERLSQLDENSDDYLPKNNVLIDCSGKKSLAPHSADYFRNGGGQYSDGSIKIIIAPWVEILEEQSLINTTYPFIYPKYIFLPPTLKQIGDEFSRSESDSVFHIPESVEKISENAFSLFHPQTKVYIHNKENSISGFPWGFETPENIFYIP